MRMLKKMWAVFLILAVVLVWWKWSDVKALFSKGESSKTDDFSNVNLDDNE